MGQDFHVLGIFPVSGLRVAHRLFHSLLPEQPWTDIAHLSPLSSKLVSESPWTQCLRQLLQIKGNWHIK